MAAGLLWRRRGRRSRLCIGLALAAGFFAFFPLLRMCTLRIWGSECAEGRCDACEPIDVVYTWVNGSDPILLESMRRFESDDGDLQPSRYDDKHELKYSLRSVELYAPWVRRIFIVTAGQLPSWLDARPPAARKNLTLVSHEDIIPEEYLPTFSSPAIECFIHRIPGLSERFLYFNDDIFLGGPVHPSDFYTPTDGYPVYTSWTVPDCARGCPWSFLGDGSCDRPCDNPLCDRDGGDCSGEPGRGRADGRPDYAAEYEESQFFDDDDEDDDFEKRDYGKAGYDDRGDLNIRQAEDAQLLQHLIDKNIGRDVKNAQIDAKHKSPIRKLNSIPDAGVPLKKIEPSIRRNAFKEIMKSFNVRNVGNAVNRFNKSIIRVNKMKKKSNNTREMYKDSRKLDTYAKSLIHTNKLLNKVYGFQNRKVPAHVPFLLEKKTIERMQEKFANEIEITKRNKFRRPNDFQFAFGYYHFLMNEKEEYSIEEIFDLYDTDKSGTWSDREVRTVLAKINGAPLTAAAVHSFEGIAEGCDSEEYRAHPTPPNERYLDSDMPTLTKKLIVDCAKLRGPLRAALGYKKLRAYPKAAATRATFAMLSSNITKAVTMLDEIRRDTKKFICINDNLNPSQESENEIIRMVLQELYEALVPLPSQWELPSHVANKFLRLSDLDAWQESRRRASQTLIACAILLFILTLYQMNCCAVFKKKIKIFYN